MHRPDVLNVYVPAAAVPGGAGRLRAPPARSADRLDRAAGQDQRRVSARDAPLRPRPAGAVGGLRQGPAQGRHRCTSTWPGSPRGGGAVRRAGRRRRPGCSAPRSVATSTGLAYPWIVRSTGVVNQFYVYAVDADFGPFFLKFCSYFPYNARLCINGHEWAKRQAAKAGIAHTALDNGFATCEDPAAVQAICDRLGPTADRRRCCASGWHDPAAPVHRRRPRRRLPLRHLRSCRPSSP